MRIAQHAGTWYTAKEAAHYSRLSQAMVNYLCRTEIVEPTCGCKRGRGSRRHYSFGDVVALRLVGRLCELGFSALRLKAALRRLSKIHSQITLQSLPAEHVVTDGRDILLHDGQARLERIFDGQFAFAFVLELAQIRDEVARRIPNEPRVHGRRQGVPRHKVYAARKSRR